MSSRGVKPVILSSTFLASNNSTFVFRPAGVVAEWCNDGTWTLRLPPFHGLEQPKPASCALIHPQSSASRLRFLDCSIALAVPTFSSKPLFHTHTSGQHTCDWRHYLLLDSYIQVNLSFIATACFWT